MSVTHLWFEDRQVAVTPFHERVAKLIFERRPYFYHQHMGRPGQWAQIDWDRAPAWYQLEMLELAHVIIAQMPVVKVAAEEPPPRSSER